MFKMKILHKKIFVIISITVITITGIFFAIFNCKGPGDDDLIAEMARRRVQAKTFQIQLTDNVHYNIFTKKYKIIIYNTETKEKTKVYAVYDENIDTQLHTRFEIDD